MMKVLVTGVDGFLGRNLCAHLAERPDVEILRFGRHSPIENLREWAAQADAVFHLAGVNRPHDPVEFSTGNRDLTALLADSMVQAGSRAPLVFSSSIQAARDNPYGRSKLAAEQSLQEAANNRGLDVHIFRLPNVFGKWSRPHYNSVVATFCHCVSRGEAIRIDDPAAELTLVYIDDVIAAMLAVLDAKAGPTPQVQPEYRITLGALADLIQSFARGRDNMLVGHVGVALERALYATYVSYLQPDDFARSVPLHGDPRGVFVEMLKTPESGQFSYFTAHPGITRGGHYHHTKTEKFLVIKGQAKFGFRHIVTGQYHVLHTSGDKPEVVDTVPGWTHDITNVGDTEMIVMLWANEIFDRQHPDTFSRSVDHEPN